MKPAEVIDAVQSAVQKALHLPDGDRMVRLVEAKRAVYAASSPISNL
jgi:hypothetical protein